MASITIHKPLKPVAAPVVEEAEQENDLDKLIDEVGRLQDAAEPVMLQIEELTKKLKPYKDKLAELGTLIAAVEAPAEEAIKLETGAYVVEAGKMGTARSIIEGKMETIKKMLGVPQFMELVNIKLGDLDKYLTPKQLKEVLSSENTARKFTLMNKSKLKIEEPAKPKAAKKTK